MTNLPVKVITVEGVAVTIQTSLEFESDHTLVVTVTGSAGEITYSSKHTQLPNSATTQAQVEANVMKLQYSVADAVAGRSNLHNIVSALVKSNV